MRKVQSGGLRAYSILPFTSHHEGYATQVQRPFRLHNCGGKSEREVCAFNFFNEASGSCRCGFAQKILFK